MALLRLEGYEWNNYAPETSTNVETTTSVSRTGSRAGRSLVGVSANAGATQVFGRFYFIVTQTPTGGQNILYGGTFAGLRWESDNRIAVIDATSSVLGYVGTYATNQWHFCEFRQYLVSSLMVWDIRINGVTVWTGLNSTVGTFGNIAICSNSSGTNYAWADDVAICDDTGSVWNTWIGPGRVVQLLPTSDVQRGVWTGGAGGTTNLWDAINNTPPIGTATETNLTQIENANGTDNFANSYRAGFSSYSAVGISNTATIRAVRAMIYHGEDVATGTKFGFFRAEDATGLYSNAGENPTGSFNYGNDVGALGTHPTNWAFYATQWTTALNLRGANSGLLTMHPTSLILSLRKSDGTTRVGSVSFMGVYIEYCPPPSLSSPGVIDITQTGATPQVTLTY